MVFITPALLELEYQPRPPCLIYEILQRTPLRLRGRKKARMAGSIFDLLLEDGEDLIL